MIYSKSLVFSPNYTHETSEKFRKPRNIFVKSALKLEEMLLLRIFKVNM